MRLTDKIENENTYCFASSNYSEDLSKYNEETEIVINKTTNKLGQLEDIEDELGVDLITLFKALQQGIYVKYAKNWDLETRPHFGAKRDFNIFFDKAFIYLNCYDELAYEKDSYKGFLKLKDYGKTWALTKEDLEDENNKN